MRLPCTFLFVLVALLGNAQSPTSDYLFTLEQNNVRATLDPRGTIGYGSANPPEYTVPADGNAIPMAGAFLWLAGKTSGGEVTGLAADWYWSENELSIGPYNVKADSYSETELELLNIPYNRVWCVTKSEIDDHREHFSEATYIMPEAIANWPGNGDTAQGFAQQIAPYVDVNNNQKYEPTSGDYPLINGDAAAFAIYHNKANDPEADYATLDCEVQVMMYAFQNGIADAIDNTVFVNYTVSNKSNTTIDTLFAGLFVDFCLGDAFDDYTGSDSTQNVFYVYNADSVDGPGFNPYPNLPAFGCKALSHPLYAYTNYSNDFSPLGFPTGLEEKYIVMTGKYKDGMPMTPDGDGYDPDDTNYTRYKFHDFPEITDGWSELSEGNTGSYRRGAGSIRELHFEPGGEICMTFALIFADAAIPYSTTASVSTLLMYADAMESLWPALVEQPCLNTFALEVTNVSHSNAVVYPNPTSGILFLQTSTATGEAHLIRIINAPGETVYAQEYSPTEGNGLMQIDLNQLPAGYYTLLDITEGKATSMTLIIQY